jgi:hypothetical protein
MHGGRFVDLNSAYVVSLTEVSYFLRSLSHIISDLPEQVALMAFRLTRASSLSYKLNFSSSNFRNHTTHDLAFWVDAFECTFVPFPINLKQYSLVHHCLSWCDEQNVGGVIHKRIQTKRSCCWLLFHASTVNGQQIKRVPDADLCAACLYKGHSNETRKKYLSDVLQK